MPTPQEIVILSEAQRSRRTCIFSRTAHELPEATHAN
jgi:hypothetical protein